MPQARQSPPEEQQKLVADGLRRLAEFADARGIDVLVENHGGLSSNAKWLAGVMKIVLDAGFRGFVGIEYEGTRLSEADGIRATKKLRMRIREQLAPSYA